MKQTVKSFGSAVLLVLLLSSTALAIPWKWTDVYDADVFFGAGGVDTFTFCHDIRDNGFTPLKDVVWTYNLELEFHDDCDRAKEVAFIDLPGILADKVVKIDYHDVKGGISLLGWLELNLTGKLKVTIDRVYGDFWFDESTLCAFGEKKCRPSAAPVPEPMTMILMGAGMLGFAGFGRRSGK